MFTDVQEMAIVDMVIRNNAIKLTEIQDRVLADNITVVGGANDRHSGCGIRPRRGFYFTENKHKMSKTRNKVSKGKIVSKINGRSGVLVLRNHEGKCSV